MKSKQWFKRNFSNSIFLKLILASISVPLTSKINCSRRLHVSAYIDRLVRNSAKNSFLIAGFIIFGNYLANGQAQINNPLFPVFLEENIFKSKKDYQGWGFIDNLGNVQIPADFSSAGHFSEGLAPVREGVLPHPLFDKEEEFFIKSVPYSVQDRKWGYIDKNGVVIIGYRFEEAGKFSEGLARIRLNGKFGFVDKSGKAVIEPQYEDVGDFSNGLAWIRINKKFGFIDASNKMVVKPNFDQVSSFSEGLAAVQLSGKFGYINQEGVIKIPATFNDAYSFSEGVAKVKVGSNFGYIKKTGDFLITPRFKECGSFSDGLSEVKVGHSWGYVNLYGKIVIPSIYEEAGPFSEGLANVRRNHLWGYIDKYGKARITATFSSAKPFLNGLGEVTKKDGIAGPNSPYTDIWVFINKTGKEVLHQVRHVYGHGMALLIFYNMVEVSLKSRPEGAEVYLIPVYDWQNDREIINDQHKLSMYRVSQGNTNLRTNQPQKIFKGVFVLKGYKIVIDIDVTEYGDKAFEVVFE